MEIQRHPVDSYDKKRNFWDEFPDYKIHPVFADFHRINKPKNLENSSRFMWALSLCYDRKSSLFPQPEQDKWELVSEDLFDDPNFIINFITAPDETDRLDIILGGSPRQLIHAFEESIDTPLGLALRNLEKKLMERTDFIMSTKYSLDEVTELPSGKTTIKKGTAAQLDKMFADTDKIVSLIQKALNDLLASESHGITKGNERESLSDGDEKF